MPNMLGMSSRTKAIWLACVASALRTTLTCAVIGLVTYYGPDILRRQINFPAFSYCVAIVIVTDASLGDAIRSFWNVLYATVQGVCPAIVILRMIGPGMLNLPTTATVVAASTFVVVAPERTPLLVKRMALGQIVIIYVTSYRYGAKYDAVMHPLHVAASTALGALACVVALLLPYPNLACDEVKKNCKLFGENIKERVKILVMASCGEEINTNTSSLAFMSQLNHLSVKATKLLKIIKSKQESMQWERGALKFLIPYCPNPEEKLQELETPIRGMKIALSSTHSFSLSSLQQELKDHLQSLNIQLKLTLDHLNTSMPNFDFTNIPKSNNENAKNTLETLNTIPQTHKELPSFFFLFCFKLLHNNLISISSSSDDHPSNLKEKSIGGLCNPCQGLFRYIPALKSSLSLGLTVLFGLMYNKDNTYWAVLIVALGLMTSREATFKVINAKVQGTVLGSIYGVLICFIFKKYFAIRFIALIPWFIFSSFLRSSRMYGPGGGISAIIGALLILGRKNYGPPNEFAFVRIVEVFIGLSSTLIADLFVKPTRASTLTKTQLAKTLHMFHDCVGLVSFGDSKNGSLGKSLKGLKAYENELRKLIGEAEVEPNFWFLPFNSGCYNKLLGSLSKMVDLLIFGMHAIRFIEQESGKIDGTSWMEIVNKLNSEIDICKQIVGSSMKCLGEVATIRSLTKLDKEIQKNNISYDLELAKSPFQLRFRSSNLDHENEVEKMTSSFIEKLKEVLDTMHIGSDNGEEVVIKSRVVLGLSALGFCMSSLVKQVREIEKGIEELIQWENPSNNVNLYEISCKLHAVYNQVS